VTLDIRWLAPAAIVATLPAVSIAAQYMSIEQARLLIFPQAQEFEAAPVKLSAEQIQRIEAQSGVRVRSPQQQVWRVQAAGTLQGWFILDQVIGKHELITYAVGINVDGTLRQFQILEYLEAYGSQVRYVNWRDQFVGKRADSALEVGVDIVNISGATMSCNHVTEGIKRLLALHAVALR
jgi:Na+-transporting NADH:ubiquinone oxidoreductase subunit NqrC